MKKEIHFSENNIQSLQVKNAFLITEVNREKERYNQLKESYEKALSDNDYRRKVFIERLSIAEKNIREEMKEVSLNSDVTVTHIDDSIRNFAKNVNPKMNIWRAIERYYPKEKGNLQDNLFKYSEQLNEERKEALKNDIEVKRGLRR